MTAPPWPDHLLTLEEWDALPEDNSRHFELAEGILIVAPRPPAMYQRAAQWLAHDLDDQLPDRLTALHEVEIVVDASFPPTVRVPDVMVTDNELAEQNFARADASDIKLAVEIVWPGSRTVDRVVKRAEYAAAGIPHYWIVDIDEPAATLTAYVLVDGFYETVADTTDTCTLSVPVPVTVDVRTLTSRRR